MSEVLILAPAAFARNDPVPLVDAACLVDPAPVVDSATDARNARLEKAFQSTARKRSGSTKRSRTSAKSEAVKKFSLDYTLGKA